MRKRAFTLIELLIVLVVIGILTAITLPVIKSIQKKAVLSEAVMMFGLIRNAEEENYLMTHSYSQLNDMTELYHDLDGTYISHHCYTCFKPNPIVGWRAGEPRSYLIFCFIGVSQTAYSPKAPYMKKLFGIGPAIMFQDYIAVDDTGKFYSDLDGVGYDPAPVVSNIFSP